MIHNNYKKLYLAFKLDHELIGMCQSEETLIEKNKNISEYFIQYIEYTDNDYIDIENIEDNSIYIRLVNNYEH